MSSNLLKGSNANVQRRNVRIIDTNTLIEKRLEELNAKYAMAQDGFKPGLDVELMELSEEEQNALDEGFDGELSGNVIKASGNENEEFPGTNAVDNNGSFDSMSLNMDEAQANAEQILANAKAEAERILREARENASREAESIRKEASEKGYEEGVRRGEDTTRLEQEKYRNLSEQLEAEYKKMFEELEPQFIDVITDVYEHIFHVDLKSYREVLIFLISATMRKIEGSRNFLIHISKEDYPYVSMQKKQLVASVSASNSSVEIVEDIALSKNECMIETDGGIFDCGLGTQLNELRQKLKLLSYEKSSN